MIIIKNPHDKFFKESFSDPELAKWFLNHYLPDNILKLLDLESIEKSTK